MDVFLEQGIAERDAGEVIIIVIGQSRIPEPLLHEPFADQPVDRGEYGRA
jgi:hypothetical protein